MTVTVNGSRTELNEGSVLQDLVKQFELKPERLAVELNRRIIRRADWASTTLSEGDTVEIVHFVGGG